MADMSNEEIREAAGDHVNEPLLSLKNGGLVEDFAPSPLLSAVAKRAWALPWWYLPEQGGPPLDRDEPREPGTY
jgi:hypothetical protein